MSIANSMAMKKNWENPEFRARMKVSGGVHYQWLKNKWKEPEFRAKMKKINALPRGEAAFNQVMGKYKSNAKKRNIGWGLSSDEFKMLTQSNCWYCGSEPFNGIQRRRKNRDSHSHKFNGDYIHNGIDRLNNNKGYVFDNCVSCCKICNQAKYTMSVTEFKQWLRKAYSVSIGDVL